MNISMKKRETKLFSEVNTGEVFKSLSIVYMKVGESKTESSLPFNAIDLFDGARQLFIDSDIVEVFNCELNEI